MVASASPTANADAEAPLQREAAPVAASAPAASADKELPKAGEPWQLNVLVVDEDDQPLPNQQVRLFLGRLTATTPELVDRERRMAPHAKEKPITPPSDDLLAVLQTDTSGRVTTTVECDSVVAAVECEGRFPAKGRLQRGVDGARERKLILPRGRRVRGRVELADGSVAPQARVRARGNYAPPPDPDALTVDANGGFELLLRPRCGYELWATVGDQTTFREQIETYREIAEPVVLHVPGARSIRGTVLDARREPLADARVQVWLDGVGKPYASRAEPESYEARSDRSGRFEIPVRSFARYGVFASAEGNCAALVQYAEPDPANAHPELLLAMPAAQQITGRVRREDGSPVAGVRVHASPPSFVVTPWGQPSLHDRFRPTHGSTDANGAFSLDVHPGTRWNLTAHPIADNPQFVVERTDVAAGTIGVDLLVGANDLRGAAVRGVVVDMQGAAVESFTLSLVAIEDGRAAGRSGNRLQRDGNRFDSIPLPVGRSYAIDVEPERPESGAAQGARVLADVRFGPFVVLDDGLDVTIRLPEVGVLPVQVVRADGGSMRGISTMLTRTPRFGAEQVSALRVDATGRSTWKRVTPGANKLAVFGPDDPVHALHEQEVVIVPGLNPELTVTLPATSTPR